ncbi:MAG: MFS transporter, partial [Planctomycetota bacterium]
TGEQVWIAGVFLTGLAVVGLFQARRIPRVPAARSDGGLVATVSGAWTAMRSDRVLWLAVLGSAFYWAIASLLAQDMLVYSKTWLELDDSVSGLPLALFAVGVGAGAVLAGRISSAKVELGLIPLGALGLSVLTLLLGLWKPDLGGTLILMTLLGVASGLVVVPLEALLQWRSPSDRRGAVIALANVFVFGGVLAGSLTALLLSWLGSSVHGIMIGASLLTMAGTAWSLWLMPVAFLRLVLVLLTQTIYRLRIKGRIHVPARGGALLVPNHVSFADGLFLLASVDRRIRFVIETTYYDHWLFRPFMKAGGAIPISASGNPKDTLRSLREAGRNLDRGELVCIFAEGQISRTGLLLPFRRGLERIAKGRDVPIIPVNLAQVWGSIFSRAGGRFLFKIPKRIPYPVTVSFGEPMPSGTPIHEIRRIVHELGEIASSENDEDRRVLHQGFLSMVRRAPLRFAYADQSRPRVSRIGAAAGAVALARAMREAWKGNERAALLLPPSVAGSLANIAASLAGKTSVNLNYTAGSNGLLSAARQAGVVSVLTSRQFVEKAKLELPGELEPIWIEDVAARIGGLERARCLLAALLLPVAWLERFAGAGRRVDPGDIATIIFSSGSTGDPKGVMLSHANIGANVDDVALVMRAQKNDRLLGILPLFHSFGYMSLWFTANHGIGVACHPNPLDPFAIGTLVERYKLTIMVATPTFLQIYLRRCTPAQFGSLRLIVAGAERLSPALADEFTEQFGVRPLVGYGMTECSPVVSVSVLDFRAPGFYQPGSRRGTVGQALPSVSVRIVDPGSFDPLGPNEPGMILVRGPNVMAGYLDRPDLTAEVMHDGWYVTGDIGLIDEDGFLRITDRLSRFSKIGGEMVPHGRVEEALQEVSGHGERVLAVTALPDERKGERLVVLHTLAEDSVPELLEKAAAGGLPNLFLPRAADFVRIDALPLLGTGKLDLAELRRIARESLETASPTPR